MKENVRIKVTGLLSGENNEEITTENRGEMLYKAPYYYVSYEEKLDKESENNSKTVLRFHERELRVTRKGEVESVLEFSRGKIHNSIYMTAFGNFDVIAETKEIKISIREERKELEVFYKLALNSMPSADGHIKITILPD